MGRFVPANSKRGRQANSFRGRGSNPVGLYPEQSTKQLSKKYAEFNSCGRMTIGRVSIKKS